MLENQTPQSGYFTAFVARLPRLELGTSRLGVIHNELTRVSRSIL